MRKKFLAKRISKPSPNRRKVGIQLPQTISQLETITGPERAVGKSVNIATEGEEVRKKPIKLGRPFLQSGTNCVKGRKKILWENTPRDSRSPRRDKNTTVKTNCGQNRIVSEKLVKNNPGKMHPGNSIWPNNPTNGRANPGQRNDTKKKKLIQKDEESNSDIDQGL